MPRNGQGTYSLPPVYEAVTGETIEAQQHNTPLEDIKNDLNLARPITAGGTGGQSATEARNNLSVYSKEETDSAILSKPSGAAAKATPVDADGVLLSDSADGGKTKRVLWSRVKAVLKAYFDDVYLALSGGRLTGALSQNSASGGVHIWATNGVVPTNPTDLTDFLTLYGSDPTAGYGLGVTSGTNSTRMNIVSRAGLAFYTNGSLAMNLDVDNTLRPQGDVISDNRTARFGTIRALGNSFGNLVHNVDGGYMLIGSYSAATYGDGSARLWWDNNGRILSFAADNGSGAVGIRVNYAYVDTATDSRYAVNLGQMNTALAGKANTSHTHTIAQVTGLQSALDGKFALGVNNQIIGDGFTGSTPRFQTRAATPYTAINFMDGGSPRGSITVTTSGTSFNTTSDYRLKPTIEPLISFELTADQFDMLDNSLLRVMAWQPVRHNWRDAPDVFIHGFLAHQLQAVSPLAVTGEKDGMEDIGTAVLPGEIIPASTRIEFQEIEGELVAVEITEPEQQLPDIVIEEVTQDCYPNAKSWTKTGEQPVYQTVDHSKLVPELAAAVQSLTLVVLEQQKAIAELQRTLAV